MNTLQEIQAEAEAERVSRELVLLRKIQVSEAQVCQFESAIRSEERDQREWKNQLQKYRSIK